MNTYLIILQGQYYRTNAYSEEQAIRKLIEKLTAKTTYKEFIEIFNPVVLNFDKVQWV